MTYSSDRPLQANQLPISFELTSKPEDLNQEIELIYKRIANAVNSKEGALYQPIETATFQQYFILGNPQQFRPTYRMTVNFGALPNTGSKSVPHGIAFDSGFRATRIYAAATDPTNLLYIALPFASPTLANNIQLFVDATNVNILTGANVSNYTDCTVVIEYTKF